MGYHIVDECEGHIPARVQTVPSDDHESHNDASKPKAREGGLLREGEPTALLLDVSTVHFSVVCKDVVRVKAVSKCKHAGSV